MKALKITSWVLFVFSAIAIGAYPAVYYFTDAIAENGLLSQKSVAVLQSGIWSTTFHTHIILGGIALLTGWSQFMSRFRAKNLALHRLLGKIYLLAVMLSGLAGFYMAIYAEGGIVAKLGFAGLAIAWLFTSTQAYTTIRKREVTAHRNWMVRSYALTFAAVTLRIWLPLFQFALGMEFFTAYVIIAWLCWVPNLIWAEWKVRRLAV